MKRILLLCMVGLIAALAFGAQEQPVTPYESAARAIMADLAARRFDKVVARYDETLAAALPADKLAASWDGVIAQVGAFQSITGIEQEQTGPYHIVYATCAFEKLSLTLQFTFNEKGQFASFRAVPPGSRSPWKAPDYAKPDAFEERAVTVHSGRWDLPGSLTIPRGAGPFPAVVLVHGSGPNDQDESIGPNKTFKDLAYGLSSRGIAVLRYTKRSRKYGAQSVEDLLTFTVKEEVIDDARAAVDMLAAMPAINSKRIFLAGHSLGAFLGPRIASGDPQIAGLILMAGNTRPLEDLVVEQVRYEADLQGPITPEAQKAIDAAELSAREFRDPNLKPGMTGHLFGAELPASYVLDLRNYHPAEVAATLKIPILILQGGRDYQVRIADFDGWKKALSSKSTVSFKLYPDLNHLFIAGTGPSSPVEYMKPGHVPEVVVADIASWIAAQGGGTK
jgi:dienelactone hydrolase